MCLWRFLRQIVGSRLGRKNEIFCNISKKMFLSHKRKFVIIFILVWAFLKKSFLKLEQGKYSKYNIIKLRKYSNSKNEYYCPASEKYTF